MPGKKLVLFIMLPIFLVGLAGAGAYVSGLADSLIGAGEPAEAELLIEEEEGPSVYYDLPDMLVNLNTSGRKTGYLKISVSLEIGSEEDAEHLDTVLPRIVDNFQVYLRELRVEDLSGSAGLQRLREELLTRVSNAAAPTPVRDVLFREMLIQ
jgi:flagellar FliL protein